MYPNYTKTFLNLEGVSIKKWSRRTLSLKFLSCHNWQNRPAPAVGLKPDGSMITACRRSRTSPYRVNT
ncbi:hypothetical protein CBFG_05793 [Clostridiales bacterium 1_7_47FAA]|nr:hypothetical protein CBFG_05793 [Clostridiales bacterium 1_7_47FAA]